MARITLKLAPEVLDRLEQRAAEQRRTVDEVVSDIAIDALGRPAGGDPRAEFRWYSQPMHALIDLEDKAAVAAALAMDD